MIKVKPKICKGTGKAIGYGCGSIQSVRKSGLGMNCKCYQNWLTTTDAGKEVLNKSIIKSKKIIDSKSKEKKKELRKKVTNWKNELQKEVNTIIRLIDAGLPCLAKNYIANRMHSRSEEHTSELQSH